MSARSRSAPWFGTPGERLAAAKDEARAEDARRTLSAPDFWVRSTLSLLARYEAHLRWWEQVDPVGMAAYRSLTHG